jgi:hypothetical protein
VHRVVAGIDRRPRDARRQVRVTQQPHAAGTGSSRSDTAAAAYSKAAGLPCIRGLRVTVPPCPSTPR